MVASTADASAPVLAFFAAVMLVQYLGGGYLSEQPVVRGIGLLFQLPVFLLQVVASSVPLATPLAVIAVIVLFVAYRQHLGSPLYAALYGCMMLLMLGI